MFFKSPFNLSIILLLLHSLNCEKISENSNKASSGSQCDPNVCKLPLCKCADVLSPGNLSLNDVPMMIMLTFNGILQKEHVDYLKKILNPIFKNPNGCPVQATFYISDSSYAKSTDYCLVQKLFNNNNEIGVGALKYRLIFWSFSINIYLPFV